MTLERQACIHLIREYIVATTEFREAVRLLTDRLHAVPQSEYEAIRAATEQARLRSEQ